MNDQELDILLSESAKRQQPIADINATVMRTVRRDMRLKAIRKWLRLLGLCFVAPMLIVLCIYVVFTFMPEMDMPLRIVTFALPLLTLVALYGKQIHDFSIF